LIVIHLAALLVAQSTAPAVPGPERVLLHTTAGDLVLELLERDAPRTVEHFKQLVRARVYEGIRVYRLEPGYLFQTSLAEERDRGLTNDQAALLTPIPRERTTLHHRRGTVTFSHGPDVPDGGVSSLSFVLGDAPELDEQYTVFAQVVAGFDVLEEIASVPLNARKQPLIYIGIEGAELVDAAEAEGRRISRRALFSAARAYAKDGMRIEVKVLVCAILFGMIALSLLASRLSRRVFQAARLLVALAGGFGLLLVLLPLGQEDPSIGLALLAGLILLFKLLGRFESPLEPAPGQGSRQS
jgi:cyclophilin family peptidyl-prolyl cis-trans isomerase